MDLSPNEAARWSRHPTPLIFNNHAPLEINSPEIQHINLNPVVSTPDAAANKERVLLLTPLRDAAPHLRRYFDILSQLTYPHALIDLAFLVGDSSDDTMGVLASQLNRLQHHPTNTPFHSATIIEKDFGVTLSQDIKDRHSFEAQGPRRKAMGRARNYLLSAALKPEHSWVYWRDVDIEESPASIIEDFTAHNRSVLVPNVWFHRFEKQQDGTMRDIEGRFDYNSWVESKQALKLAASLPKDVVLAEGIFPLLFVILFSEHISNPHHPPSPFHHQATPFPPTLSPQLPQHH